MALPSPMGTSRCEQREDTLVWTTKAGEAVWQQGRFGTTLDQGTKDRHRPFPIPRNVGLGPESLQVLFMPFHHAHLFTPAQVS